MDTCEGASTVRFAAKHIADTESQPPLPDKPSIAVLPFQNMSGDPEQEYFADGIVTAVSRPLSLISDMMRGRVRRPHVCSRSIPALKYPLGSLGACKQTRSC